jgi:hypothetical protein
MRAIPASEVTEKPSVLKLTIPPIFSTENKRPIKNKASVIKVLSFMLKVYARWSYLSTVNLTRSSEFGCDQGNSSHTLSGLVMSKYSLALYTTGKFSFFVV